MKQGSVNLLNLSAILDIQFWKFHPNELHLVGNHILTSIIHFLTEISLSLSL